MRTSTALQVSDIMFMDKQKKFEIAETGLNEKYKNLIFSGTQHLFT